MSRLLPSLFSHLTGARLYLALSAEGIAIVQQSSGFKKQLIKQQYVSNNQAKNSANWQSIVNQLDDSLSQLKPAKNTLVTVVLSSDFVRYLILPVQQIAMNFAEKMAYVQAAYREIYGAAADSWQIKCHDSAPHQSTLAVATDCQLIVALSQLMAKHQLNLHSVQPYLMTAFNGLMPQIAQKNGYLVLLENTKLQLVQLQNGICQQLRTVSCHDDWQLDLQQAIQREMVLNEHAENRVLVYAPAHKNTALKPMQGFTIEKIGEKIGLKNGLSNRPKSELINDAHFALLEAVI